MSPATGAPRKPTRRAIAKAAEPVPALRVVGYEPATAATATQATHSPRHRASPPGVAAMPAPHVVRSEIATTTATRPTTGSAGCMGNGQ